MWPLPSKRSAVKDIYFFLYFYRKTPKLLLKIRIKVIESKSYDYEFPKLSNNANRIFQFSVKYVNARPRRRLIRND
jgi:hypothetical protein